jgi:hypothetical protein
MAIPVVWKGGIVTRELETVIPVKLAPTLAGKPFIRP